MLEKLIDFNIAVFHLPGTKNVTADFLSRHTLPSKEAPEFPRGKRSVLVRTVKSQETTREDGSLWKVAERTADCKETKNIIEAVKKGLEVKELPTDHPGRTLADIWQNAGVENAAKGEILTFGEKVFIPKAMRRELLQTLHSTHLGEDRMF